MSTFNESHVEKAALAWLRDAGWKTACGPGLAPGMPNAERARQATGSGVP